MQKLYPTLRDTLGPAWTLVPLPGANLAPGEIVQVNPLDGKPLSQSQQIDIVRFGTLQDCKVPASAVQVTDSAVPTMTLGATYSLDASIGASLAKIASVDLGANASSTADFTINKATDSTLDYIVLANWAADPTNAQTMRSACQSIFNQPNVYVVNEAFIVSDGNYSFKDNYGGKIDVTPPPNVPVHGSVDGSTGSSGGLTVSTPIVFALKTLQPLPQGGFQLAQAAPPPPPRFTGHHSAAARKHYAVPPPPPAPGPLTLGGRTIGAVQPAPSP